MNTVTADETQRQSPTAFSIVWHVTWRFALQGLMRGGLYGAGYGGLYILANAPIGIGYGLLIGLLIGAGVGAIMGLIGGVGLSAFNVFWSRRRNEALSPEDTIYRDGYRRGVNLIAIGTTFVGSLLLFPTAFWLWLSDFFRGASGYLFLDLVPSLIAAFAAYRAAKKIIHWYEDHVREPINVVSLSEAPLGVWPPPPIQPKDS